MVAGPVVIAYDDDRQRLGHRHAHLSEVVQEAADGNARHILNGKTMLRGKQAAESGHAPQMAAGIGIAGLDERGQT